MINSPTSSNYSGVEARPLGLGALMISSLGRMTLGSLGFGSSLEYRLPPLHTNSVGKLVQVSVRKLYTQGRWSKTNTSIFLQVWYKGFFLYCRLAAEIVRPCRKRPILPAGPAFTRIPVAQLPRRGCPTIPNSKRAGKSLWRSAPRPRARGTMPNWSSSMGRPSRTLPTWTLSSRQVHFFHAPWQCFTFLGAIVLVHGVRCNLAVNS